jgi:hypothetical protein
LTNEWEGVQVKPICYSIGRHCWRNAISARLPVTLGADVQTHTACFLSNCSAGISSKLTYRDGLAIMLHSQQSALSFTGFHELSSPCQHADRRPLIVDQKYQA